MKSQIKQLGSVLLVIVILICYGKAWGVDWKEFAHATTGTFYYDVSSFHSPSPNAIRVWIHNADKRETSFIEINCKEKSYQVLDHIEYDETGHIKERYLYYDNPTRLSIHPNSVAESLQKTVCP